jgi:hypothetical protein
MLLLKPTTKLERQVRNTKLLRKLKTLFLKLRDLDSELMLSLLVFFMERERLSLTVTSKRHGFKTPQDFQFVVKVKTTFPPSMLLILLAWSRK